MAVTTTTFDSLLSGLSSEATNSVEIIMRNTSTGVSKKMSFATFAALLYAWITSNKASDLASVLGGLFPNNGNASSFDGATSDGMYTVSGLTIPTLSQYSLYGGLLVLHSGGIIIQIVVANHVFAARAYVGSWSGWIGCA